MLFLTSSPIKSLLVFSHYVCWCWLIKLKLKSTIKQIICWQSLCTIWYLNFISSCNIAPHQPHFSIINQKIIWLLLQIQFWNEYMHFKSKLNACICLWCVSWVLLQMTFGFCYIPWIIRGKNDSDRGNCHFVVELIPLPWISLRFCFSGVWDETGI